MRRLVAITLLLAACAEDPAPVRDPDDGAALEPPSGECAADADCAAQGASLVCREGACVERSEEPPARTWHLPAGPTGIGLVSAIHVQGETILAGGYGTMGTSLDGGATWREATHFPDGRVETIVAAGSAFFTRHADGLLAVTRDGVGWYAPAAQLTAFDLQARGEELYVIGMDDAGHFGLFHSPNAGGVWSQVPGVDPDQLAIGDGWLVAAERRTATLKRSEDGGATWSELPDPPPDVPGAETILRAWQGAVVALARPFQALVSRDRGESWERQALTLSSSASTMWLVGTGDGLFAANDAGQVFRLEAPGGRWVAARGGLPAGVGIDAFAGGADGAFAVAGGSLLRFDPAAGAWSAAPRPVVRTAVRELASDGETVWAVVDERAIHRSDDGGRSWTEVASPGAQAFPIRSIAAGDGRVWIGSTWAGVLVSEDGGASWRSLAGGLPHYNGMAGMQPWGAEDLLYRDGTLYAATYGFTSFGGGDGNFVQAGAGVLRSTDGGESWDEGGAGLPAIGAGLTDGTSRVIEAGGALFTFAAANGLYRSTDGGASWHPSSRGWPAIEAVDAPAPLLDLVEFEGALWAAADTGSGGLVRSEDGGTSWSTVETLPPGPCAAWALAVVDGRLVLGWARPNDTVASEGIYVLDGGAWVRLGEGPIQPPAAIRLLRLGDALLAGTEGNGVWRWAAE